VTILSGLAPGDRVVIAGAFALRSELAKGEIGEHGH
jgi:multidrug efflux pump subunit AcrA (membrane-fusion protein)